MILCSNLTIFYYSNSLSKESGIQLVYFALVLFPFIIFHSTERLSKAIGIAIPIICMTYSELTHYTLFPQVIIINQIYYDILYLTIIFINFSQLSHSFQKQG